MSEKPMKFAVEAFTAAKQFDGVSPLAIQRAAEPLLAVVCATKREDPQGSNDYRCGICGSPWSNHRLECPVPAALAAMEVE